MCVQSEEGHSPFGTDHTTLSADFANGPRLVGQQAAELRNDLDARLWQAAESPSADSALPEPPSQAADCTKPVPMPVDDDGAGAAAATSSAPSATPTSQVCCSNGLQSRAVQCHDFPQAALSSCCMRQVEKCSTAVHQMLTRTCACNIKQYLAGVLHVWQQACFLFHQSPSLLKIFSRHEQVRRVHDGARLITCKFDDSHSCSALPDAKRSLSSKQARAQLCLLAPRSNLEEVNGFYHLTEMCAAFSGSGASCSKATGGAGPRAA